MIRRTASLGLLALALAACQPDPLNSRNIPDGRPGNPPGTEVSRANQRVGDPLNTAGRPDGTAGNPPGTGATRANARAGDPLNLQGRPDCTPGNRPGTAVSRTLGTTSPDTCR